MKANLLIVMLLIGLIISCNTNQKNKEYSKFKNSTTANTSLNEGVVQNIESDSKGYELMKQKCYICHFEKPDPTKRNQMIAPPMLRIQEHYKSTYTNKDEFVNAIMTFVKSPSKEKTIMPGAVRKFKLMPKLIYVDTELRLILETIYDYDFGSVPKMRKQIMGNMLQLNNDKKWILKKESMQQIRDVVSKLNNYKSTNVADYNQLGREVFNGVKNIILDDSYTDELFNQIHIFFFGIENYMHTLMAAKSENEAEKQLSELKNKFKEFYTYFE